MKWKHIASVGLLCLLSACTKSSSDKILEDFTLSGTVSEHDGAHLGGVHVVVTASDYSPLTGKNNRFAAGETTTDGGGHYAVTPVSYGGVTFFELKLEKEGYYDKIVTIPAELAKQSPKNNYSLDIDMNKR